MEPPFSVCTKLQKLRVGHMAAKIIKSATMNNKKVCVTGANGYIARHLIYQLLEKGYSVVGTVRDLENEKKVGYLKHMQQVFGQDQFQLVIVKDLRQRGALDQILESCIGVFHTASPAAITGPLSEEEAWEKYIGPAVEGTQHVLESCLKNRETVKRIVITSSLSALYNHSNPETDHITEENWNTNSKVSDQGGAYRISKVKAEQLAWNFSKEHGIEIAVVAPTIVLGAILPGPTDSIPHRFQTQESRQEIVTSIELLYNHLSGQLKYCANAMNSFVSVNDVARIHIMAFEKKEAAGQRYLAAGHMDTRVGICEKLKKMYPQLPIPTSLDPNNDNTPPFKHTVDGSKAEREMSFTYEPLEQYLQSMTDSLLRLGYLQCS